MMNAMSLHDGRAGPHEEHARDEGSRKYTAKPEASKCAVARDWRQGEIMYQNIYVPLDNSEHSNACVDMAVTLGKQLGANLIGSHAYAAKMHDYRFKQMEFTLPEEYLLDRLAVMLGGRCAEQELLGTISSGADDDIAQATALARAMVSRWGMSREIGPVDLRDSEEHPFLGREIAQPRRFSENSAQAVDHAVKQLLKDAEARALELIRQQRSQLDSLIQNLEQNETLGREQVKSCLEG